MAAKELKINFSGDTKSYRQEVDKAAIATNKFQKDAGSAMSNLAGVFGINIAQIKGSVDGMSKGFTMLLTSMKASTAGATIFSAAMKIVKIAAISTGIGALIVALGSLVAYFTKTREGANFVKQVMAGLGAAVRVVVDHFSSFGEGIVKLFKGDWAGSAAAFKSSVTGIGKEIIEETKLAAELQKRTQEVNKFERESMVLNEEKRAQAAELRRDAKDAEEFNAKERKAKLAEAKNLLIEINKDEKWIAGERLSIHQAEIGMRKKSSEDLNTERDLKMKMSQLDRETAMDQKGLLREMKGVTKEINAQEKAILNKEAARRKELITEAGGKPKQMFAGAPKAEIGAKVEEDQSKKLRSLAHNAENWAAKANNAQNNVANNALTASSTFAAAWSGASTAVVNASGAINTALGDIATGTGEMIGTFLSGGDQAQSFGMMIAGAFADMAITVGKIAIGAGIATLGIKAAFESMNGFAAIGAGIALVALGTAVKGSLKRVASGGASASASGGGANGNYNFDSRQSATPAKMQTVNVVVSGEFKQKGNALVAVINQENQRKNAVT